MLFCVFVLKYPLVYAQSTSNPQFIDITEKSGITFKHVNGASKDKIMVETFGSGVAWIDYNNDGFIDLFFANGADLKNKLESPGNVLMRNTGKGTFVDTSSQAGIIGNKGFSTGVAVGDYDNDGWLDIYLTGFETNQLLHNNHDGTFSDLTLKAQVKGGGWSSSAGFFDYDKDGDLDLYVVRYLDYLPKDDPYCGLKKDGWRMYCDPRNFDGITDILYRNNSDGTFIDASKAAGIANPAGKGLGVAFGDINNDGWQDIYIANDTVRNFLYLNKGNGTFSDIAYSANAGYDPNGKPRAGMGVDIADYDNDGFLDLFVTNFSEEFNGLFHNNGDLTFNDIAEESGLASSFLYLGFGTKFFDFDNDGDLDIYVANGHVIDNVELYHKHLTYKQTDLLYQNNNGRFTDISKRGGAGLQINHVGRGAAAGDFDNDGDLDLIVTNNGDKPTLLRNDGGNQKNWLMISARGKESNSFGIGARIRIETSSSIQAREINNASSYLSSNDVRLHVGLGSDSQVKRLTIIWPSGKKQVMINVPANQVLVLDERNAS